MNKHLVSWIGKNDLDAAAGVMDPFVDRFETPFGLELLSTVHWVVKNENVQSEHDTILKVRNWSEKKKKFSSRQITLALKALTQKGWLDTQKCTGKIKVVD